MLHVARNPTVRLPIDVPMFDGYAPMSGEADNLSVRIMCMDNGYTQDIDGVFKLNAAAPFKSMTPYSKYSNIYGLTLSPGSFLRGHYRAITTHTSGQVWYADFGVGLFVDRKLAYSAVYDGVSIRMSAWVEENGDAQTDFTWIRNVCIKDMSGNIVSVFDDVAGSDGLFVVQFSAELLANHNYFFECLAEVPGPDTCPPYHFPLRVGMARP